jgi:hypothetical protein
MRDILELSSSEKGGEERRERDERRGEKRRSFFSRRHVGGSPSPARGETMTPSLAVRQELQARLAAYEQLLRLHAGHATVRSEAPAGVDASVARVHYQERQRRRRAKKKSRRESKKKDAGSGEDGYVCAITLEDVAKLQNPMVMSDGHVYERDAAYAWLRRDRRSPVTREALAPWGVPLAQARAACARVASSQ